MLNDLRRAKRVRTSLASYIEGDAVEFLASHRLSGDDLVYCDPP